MTAPSPACTYTDNSATYPNPQSATPFFATANNVSGQISLANSAGANQWSLTCISTDESSSAAAINATISINQATKVATFTTSGTASGLLFRFMVGVRGLGINGAGQNDPTLTTTFEIDVLSSTGNAVMIAGESAEYGATFGWVPKVNQFTRASFGWQSSLLLDLTAQGTINVSANEAVTIAGKSWTRANAANDSSALTLTSSGLTGTPTPGTHYNNGGGISACGLYIPITSLIPTIYPSMPVRVSIYCPTMTGAVGTIAAACLYNSAAECLVYSGRYISANTNVTEPGHLWQLSSGTGAGVVVDSGQTTANVFQIEFPSGIGSMLAYCRCGVWSSGYPAASSIVTSYQTNPFAYSDTSTFSAYMGTLSNWNLFLGIANVLSNGLGSGTIANLLVESRQ